MMVNELGNTLGGMAVARDYRATRMTLFVYFWNGVKLKRPRLRYFAVSSSIISSNCRPEMYFFDTFMSKRRSVIVNFFVELYVI